MQSIRFGRHFLALAMAAVVFALFSHFSPLLHLGKRDILLQDILLPYWFMGALHATAVVVSLQERTHLALELIFVILIGVASKVTAFSIFLFAPLIALLGFHGDSAGSTAFVFASAFGASAYWLLVRSFWLKWLPLRSLGVSIAMCCAGTVASMFGASLVMRQWALPSSAAGEITYLLPTLCWWLAFSLSLYWNQALAGRVTPQPLSPQRA